MTSWIVEEKEGRAPYRWFPAASTLYKSQHSAVTKAQRILADQNALATVNTWLRPPIATRVVRITSNNQQHPHAEVIAFYPRTPAHAANRPTTTRPSPHGGNEIIEAPPPAEGEECVPVVGEVADNLEGAREARDADVPA